MKHVLQRQELDSVLFYTGVDERDGVHFWTVTVSLGALSPSVLSAVTRKEVFDPLKCRVVLNRVVALLPIKV